MKTRIGAILAIVLGALLVTVGATGAGSSVGVSLVPCGGAVPIGAIVPACPTGHIVITKVIDGPASVAPAAGWDFTISSSDCSIYPGSSTAVHIAAAGGTQSSDLLYATQYTTGSTACHYTVTETAVTGWTAAYAPTGTLALPNTSSTGNDVTLTVTNSHAPITTSAAPTTSAVVSSSVAPGTSTENTASVSATSVLANTGTHNALPEIVVGSVLIGLGGVLLLFGRRPRGARH